MVIHCDYNPYLNKTSISINGKRISQDHVLYSIYQYPLQSWLTANGSWVGFAAMLSRISRGEEISLSFRGREIDFDDFSRALPSYQVQFEPAYPQEASLSILKRYATILEEQFGLTCDLKAPSFDLNNAIHILDDRYMLRGLIQMSNRSIYILQINNIDDERYLDWVMQSMQASNLYHSAENALFVYRENNVLSTEDVQVLLVRKGIRDAFVVPYQEDPNASFHIGQVIESRRGQVEEKLKGLYEKYVLPWLLRQDALQLLKQVSAVKAETENTEEIEQAYYETCKKINSAQSSCNTVTAQADLQRLIELNQTLLMRLRFLKDEGNRNTIDEILQQMNEYFGIQGGGNDAEE